MTTGVALREDVLAVDAHLEDSTRGGADRQALYLVFELLEDAVRQTDGTWCIASGSAVFDAYFHGC